MNRREMLKLSVLTGGAVLLSGETNEARAETHPTGGIFDPPSPPITNPFTVKLPRMPSKTPLPGGASDLRRLENGGVAPNGTVYPQVTGNDALTTYVNSPERIVAAQQRNSGSNIQFPPQHFYVLNVTQNDRHQFHSDFPYNQGTTIWGFDGSYPGPTFVSRYGEPILVRIINGLFFDENGNPRTPARKMPGGFGSPRLSTHLHNGHTASESDGNPADFYPPYPVPGHLPPYPPSIRNLRFRDHHYAMFRAGLDPRSAATKNDGDPLETVSTLWYHDHSMDHTAENVYAGLVGFHLLFDELDSGDENDPNPEALRLPSGEFDIPLLIQDKRFDAQGQLLLPDPNFDDCSDPTTCFRLGVLGDRFVVNGVIQPKLAVSRRKYRFRLLNAGPSRFYQFFLTKDDQDQAFVQIGNDESLLAEPYDVPPHEGLLMSVSERADIVIDFSQFNINDKLFLVNRLVMRNEGFGPEPGDVLGTYQTLPEGQGDQILRFDVTDDPRAPDPSKVPQKLRASPALPAAVKDVPRDQLKQLPNHRTFEFGFQPDGLQPKWLINGVEFDPSPAGSPKAPDGRLRPVGCHTTPDGKLSPLAACPTMPRAGLPGELMHDGEVWTIKNTGPWAHPVHIHLEEFQILWRNGNRPPLPERSKKDVLRLDPDEEVQIFMRFRDFYGKYPIHCHNVLHEDHEMMLRFDVVGDS